MNFEAMPTEQLVNELQSFGARLEDPDAGVASRQGGAGPSDHKAMTIGGMNADSTIKTPDGKHGNLWEHLHIPCLSVMGDAPFYFLDRHILPSNAHGLAYGFADHVMLRKRLPHPKGLLAVMPPACLNVERFESVDFTAKQKGKLLFLKNGNDAPRLVDIWKRTLSPEMASALIEIADALTVGDAIDECFGTHIDDMVLAYFAERGFDIEAMPALRVLLDAHLDDYVRRIKSTMIAEVLSDYPVVIHGENWEHMDFSAKRCTFIPGSDWETSRGMIRNALGLIDMSPNTAYGLHDRVTRAFGTYTLCLTNEQQFVTDLLPSHHAQMTYRFNRESIGARVEYILENPRAALELGVATSEIFQQHYTASNLVRCTILAAETIRLSISSRRPEMQDFVVWPPTRL